MLLQLQPLFDLLSDDLKTSGRLETSDNLTFLVDQELGEVPLDVGAFLIVRISLAQHLVEHWVERMCLIPTSKTLGFFQELKQW